MMAVSRTYGAGATAVKALNSVNLAIEDGEFVAVMGPSGSGKSTLMNILGLLDRATAGRYLIGGEDVFMLTEDELAARRNQHFGFVFQNFNLLPRASAAENVALPLIYRGIDAIERRRKAIEALEAVGLVHRRHHKPKELSGGEQQRLAIARAMIGSPLILLADEPTGALDTETGNDILGLIQQLHASGRTIVLITHDNSVAVRASRIVYMRDGEIVSGPAVPATRYRDLEVQK